MKQILITGCRGQLGRSISKIADRYGSVSLHLTDVDTLDITKKSEIEKYVIHNSISTIVNCAAYTAVDKAEEEADICRNINTLAPQILGEVASKHKIRVVHISTDYVFDGKSCTPYQESDETKPTSTYGETKRDGEQALINSGAKATIIRTSWLYSEYGNNFVKTISRLCNERDSLNVIFDQVGTPTYATDLAKAIMHIVTTEDYAFAENIYHYSNEGVCSWYDFAVKIAELSNSNCKINPIETKDYITPVARPHYSVLNKNKIKTTFGINIPHWEASLKQYFKQQ